MSHLYHAMVQRAMKLLSRLIYALWLVLALLLSLFILIIFSPGGALLFLLPAWHTTVFVSLVVGLLLICAWFFAAFKPRHTTP